MNSEFSLSWGWHRVLETVENVPETFAKLYLSRVDAVAMEEDTLFLYNDNPFVCGCVGQYRNALAEAASAVWGREISVIITDNCDWEERRLLSALLLKINPEFEECFATFAVGEENRLAWNAAKAVCKEPGNIYSPLVICGGDGVGKTHLLQAIGAALLEENPQYQIVWTNGDNFTQDLIYALKWGKRRELEEVYRQADVLMIDDIQGLTRRETTQEWLCGLLEYFFKNKKQVVLTSNRPLDAFPKLSGQLKGDLICGLQVDMGMDRDTRKAVVKRFAEKFEAPLSEEDIAYITETTSGGKAVRGGVLREKLMAELLMECAGELPREVPEH